MHWLDEFLKRKEQELTATTATGGFGGGKPSIDFSMPIQEQGLAIEPTEVLPAEPEREKKTSRDLIEDMLDVVLEDIRGIDEEVKKPEFKTAPKYQKGAGFATNFSNLVMSLLTPGEELEGERKAKRGYEEKQRAEKALRKEKGIERALRITEFLAKTEAEEEKTRREEKAARIKKAEEPAKLSYMEKKAADLGIDYTQPGWERETRKRVTKIAEIDLKNEESLLESRDASTALKKIQADIKKLAYDTADRLGVDREKFASAFISFFNTIYTKSVDFRGEMTKTVAQIVNEAHDATMAMMGITKRAGREERLPGHPFEAGGVFDTEKVKRRTDRYNEIARENPDLTEEEIFDKMIKEGI